jgi:hypothetical protein
MIGRRPLILLNFKSEEKVGATACLIGDIQREVRIGCADLVIIIWGHRRHNIIFLFSLLYNDTFLSLLLFSRDIAITILLECVSQALKFLLVDKLSFIILINLEIFIYLMIFRSEIS